MIILLSHIIFVKIGLMKLLKETAYKDHLQLVPAKLLEFRNSHTGTLWNGYVIATTSDSVIIQTVENETLEIFKDPNPENSINLNEFLVGVHVNAYGIKTNGKIVAKTLIIVE